MRLDLAGQEHGRWTVLRFHESVPFHGGRKTAWWCRCVCGTERSVLGSNLVAGKSKSCGCLDADLREARNFRHGHSARGNHSPTYRSWALMMQRCYTPGATSYPWYGAKGIGVTPRWHDFRNFLHDMGERPGTGRTQIGRKDHSLDYSLSNCRWELVRLKPSRPLYRKRNRSMQVYELRSDTQYDCFATKREAFAEAIEMMHKGEGGRIFRIDFDRTITTKELVLGLIKGSGLASRDGGLFTEEEEFDFREDLKFMMLEAQTKLGQMQRSAGNAKSAKKKTKKVSKKKATPKKASKKKAAKKKATRKKVPYKSTVKLPGKKKSSKKKSSKKKASKKKAAKLRRPPPVPK